MNAREIAEKRIGRTLRNKWTLERLIGVGGMAAVYAARHRNGMRGAVKVLDPSLSRHAVNVERFLREGRIANEVKHVGAVRVLDDDETADGCRFLVMELLDGATLDQLAERRGGKLTPPEVAAYAAQVLDTLVVAHAAGILHRDIKPENIFLTKTGVVKVVDFGIAKMNDGTSCRLTRSGDALGTPAFMPPEQARGRMELMDARSDIYSLGATMYTLLTGDVVHPAGTVEEVLVLAVTRPAPRLVAPNVPEPLAAIVNRALEFARERRFPSTLDMRASLEDAYRTMTGENIPDTPRAIEELATISSSPCAVTRAPMGERWIRPVAAVVPVLAIALAYAALRSPHNPHAPMTLPAKGANIVEGKTAVAHAEDPTPTAATPPPAPPIAPPIPATRIPAIDPMSRRSTLFERRD